ncbi:hypothetical protein [Aidingimonas halophila]|uniref:Morphogenetic protein n=1 Tax=Aidingimonas halophila TaxID=574349 RepID=A0A1H2RHG6_9GAMM|nr:hypothetical protein [Aidingimonas halophila]GHC19212.1 hypothetical protein GCM10008094_06460 [Aidingimonas halophila]SDW18902.1 hypothetical protein SAMN05443545_101326 [Aidingimonas halophila]
MKEHGRIFTGDNVRAILDGRKSQTRRIVTPQNSLIDGHGASAKAWQTMGLDLDSAWVDNGPSPGGWPGPFLKVPAADGTVHRLYSRIQPGDRIWGREAFRNRRVDSLPGDVDYRADNPGVATVPGSYGRSWKPSIHMPRWASRITLEVTDVRVERLQDISDADAAAEGIGFHGCMGIPGDKSWLRMHFQQLWEDINGPGSWGANPIVWAYSFQRIDDQQEAT